MSYCWVYTTTAGMEEAKTIGHILVEERLAACVNIWPEILSIYRWSGSVEQDREVALVAKTKADCFDSIKNRILELHSYDNPCILQVPITDGALPYLKWINDETSI